MSPIAKSVFLTALFAAVSGILGACDGADPVAPETLVKLLDKPDGSYALIAQTSGTGDKLTYTGTFDLVVKQNDYRNDNAFDAKGNSGASFCANFMDIPVTMGKDGSLHAVYESPGYKSTHLAYGPAIQDMQPSALLAIPQKIKDIGTLDFTPVLHCRFTSQLMNAPT